MERFKRMSVFLMGAAVVFAGAGVYIAVSHRSVDAEAGVSFFDAGAFLAFAIIARVCERLT